MEGNPEVQLFKLNSRLEFSKGNRDERSRKRGKITHIK
ncbi:hypothetical protein CCACVL1_19877, partial [Corchorus capsularis]